MFTCKKSFDGKRYRSRLNSEDKYMFVAGFIST